MPGIKTTYRLPADTLEKIKKIKGKLTLSNNTQVIILAIDRMARQEKL